MQLTKHRNVNGFTLVEVIVVLLLIVMMVSLSMPVISGMTENTKYQITEARVSQIKNAIVNMQTVNGIPVVSGFAADVGRLPYCIRELVDGTCPNTTNINLNLTDIPNNWQGPYLQTSDGSFFDGWGNGSTADDNFGWNFLLIASGAYTVSGSGICNYPYNSSTPTQVLCDTAMLQSYGADGASGGSNYDEDYPPAPYATQTTYPSQTTYPNFYYYHESSKSHPSLPQHMLTTPKDWQINPLNSSIQPSITINLQADYAGYCATTLQHMCNGVGGAWITATCNITGTGGSCTYAFSGAAACSGTATCTLATNAYTCAGTGFCGFTGAGTCTATGSATCSTSVYCSMNQAQTQNNCSSILGGVLNSSSQCELTDNTMSENSCPNLPENFGATWDNTNNQCVLNNLKYGATTCNSLGGSPATENGNLCGIPKATSLQSICSAIGGTVNSSHCDISAETKLPLSYQYQLGTLLTSGSTDTAKPATLLSSVSAPSVTAAMCQSAAYSGTWSYATSTICLNLFNPKTGLFIASASATITNDGQPHSVSFQFPSGTGLFPGQMAISVTHPNSSGVCDGSANNAVYPANHSTTQTPQAFMPNTQPIFNW